MADVVVEKSGIRWLNLEISRKREDGSINFSFKADPRVEEYFELITKKKVADLREAYAGVDWFNPDPNSAPFLSYYVNHEQFIRASSFFLGYPGHPMIGTEGTTKGKINLSFLHLKGVTEGVSFSIKLPTSKSEMLDIRQKIEDGVKEFVREYLTTVRIVLQVSSYEV